MRCIENNNRGSDDLTCSPSSVINQDFGPVTKSLCIPHLWGGDNSDHLKMWLLKLRLRKKGKEEKLCVNWRKPLINCEVVYKESSIILIYWTLNFVTYQSSYTWDTKWWLQRTSNALIHHKTTVRRLMASPEAVRHNQLSLSQLVIHEDSCHLQDQPLTFCSGDVQLILEGDGNAHFLMILQPSQSWSRESNLKLVGI